MQQTGTKIVCTLGPSTSSKDSIRELAKAGMSVARLNFSHGTHQQHRELFEILRAVEAEIARPLAILQDLSGPKIRIGEFAKPPVILHPDYEFSIIADANIAGDETKVGCNYPELASELEPGNVVLLADGAVELEVVEVKGKEIRCKVVVGGELSNHKGLNLKSGYLKASAITNKDKKDLEFGIELGVDFVALSFVKDAFDIAQAKQIIEEHDKNIPVIAKIERHEALENLDEIIDAADGIMVARGDLGVEVDFSDVPLLQKQIIRKCNKKAKPVIVATQMLKSMVEAKKPTRAEANDVANAIIDGADAVMLSEETAVGKYPVKAVETIRQIAAKVEQTTHWREHYLFELEKGNSDALIKDIAESVSVSAFNLSKQLGAACLIVPTSSGSTARKIARFRPLAKILAISDKNQTIRELALCWGVVPYIVPGFGKLDEIIEAAKQFALNENFGKPGDIVILIAGFPVGVPGTTNFIKVGKLPRNREEREVTIRMFAGKYKTD